MSPSSTVHGGQYDTKNVTFEECSYCMRHSCWTQFGKKILNQLVYVYLVRMERTFFAHCLAFLYGPRVFTRALSRGARRGARRYSRRTFWAQPGSVARALGVQSRSSWRVMTGSLSAELSPTRPMETPKVKFISIFHLSFAVCTKAAVKG